MKKHFLFLLFCVLTVSCTQQNFDLEKNSSPSDLKFDTLAVTWDEGIPLGNSVVGSLMWKRGQNLRFSLDRTDLWDLRPTDSISGPNNRFSWVKEQVDKGDYLPVQEKFDKPYGSLPAPSKIPGAALEFSLEHLGDPNQVQLYINNALCEVKWENGVSMQTFVHADKPIGWFVFTNLPDSIPVNINLVAPRYSGLEEGENPDSIKVNDLRELGYEQGKPRKKGNKIHYHQKGWGDFTYDAIVEWKYAGNTLYGVWSLTTSLSSDQAEKSVKSAFSRGLNKDYKSHMHFWNSFWKQSSVNLPDTTLQKQYDNEMYKFGSATRENSYPISLQAVWTADNGKLPPWKGDYHHDLNTQLSYWPAYTGNHLKGGLGYLNTLWNQQDAYKKYTKEFFEVDGLNIPGVCTLVGEPMGGWIQYSMSPTISAWLAQHFYLHWKYSGDKVF